MTKRTYDAVPDAVDVRDWFYQPTLKVLPEQIDNRNQVPLILDQGTEGACTGFALGAVINYLIANQKTQLPGEHGMMGVSPRMLYELARRYDEWPGERYEGSSARGAMKGWINHGVAARSLWPDECKGMRFFNKQIAEAANEFPGGAYFRIQPQTLRDVHAALAETGAVYATVMVHKGWSDVHPRRNGQLPVIEMHDEIEGGHAIALVGYNEDGFILQNSWGNNWGLNGFALLTYDDFAAHVTDLWVAQLGVPIQRASANRMTMETPSTFARAQAPKLEEVRNHIVNIGNDGYLSDSGDYWTTTDDLQRMFDPQNGLIKQSGCEHVMLYMHGGLNNEESSARRVVAMTPVALRNRIYPIHIMWETGVFETVRAMIEDKLGLLDREKAGNLFGDARDFFFEATLGKLAKPLWNEMKENARLASTSDRHERSRGMRLVIDHLHAYGKANALNLHVVAHSAGSILFAHSLSAMLDKKLPPQSVQMLAPAVSVERFMFDVYPKVDAGHCPVPRLYNLADKAEQDDNVGKSWIYGKSLLYLVSNSMESDRGKSLLGMEIGLRSDTKLQKLYYDANKPNVEHLVYASEESRDSRSSSHGGFDNDPFTMNSVLSRILGRFPEPAYTARDLENA